MKNRSSKTLPHTDVWIKAAAETSEAVAIRLTSSVTNGLTSAQAATQYQAYGPNEVPAHSRSWIMLLTEQYATIPNFALLGVATLYIVTQSYTEAVVVGIILIANGLLGFVQEYRSDKALLLLQQYLSQPVSVIRDSVETELPARLLVPGDLVKLRTGDIVPADIRIVALHACSVDESSMTGESLPVAKAVTPLATPPQTMLEAHCIAFAGTEMASGLLTGIVIATGTTTGLGEIQKHAHATLRTSTFAEQMPSISLVIGLLIALSVSVVVTLHLLFNGLTAENIRHIAILAAALIVTIIPETLPLVITCSLSQGAVQLAQHGAIVKRLSAIADLGHMELLCTDKTGTLTEHHLTVTQVYATDQARTLLFARLAGASPNLPTASLRGFDRAVDAYLTPALKQQLTQYHRLAEAPFDHLTRSSMTMITDGAHEQVLMFGAPEQVLPYCTSLDQTTLEQIKAAYHAAGKRGERVIAVGLRPATSEELAERSIKTDLPLTEYIGMIACSDPIKKSAFEALAHARALNVRIKIISGDSAEVCGFVAQQLQITSNVQEVMLGETWMNLPPAEQAAAAERYSVFARCTPQHKAALIRHFKSFAAVGYLGDGINDTLPLREAHVALAVQNAPRIVYEAADIVLTRKSLRTIVNAIAAGRTMMHNLLSYMRITLAANFGNFYSISLAALFIDFPAAFPLHMLIVNLLSDAPLVALSTDAVDPQELKHPSRFDRKRILFETLLLGALNSGCDLVFILLLWRTTPGVFETAWVTWSTLSELVILFSLRSSLSAFRAQQPSWQLLVITLIVLGITIALPQTDWGERMLHYSPLTPFHFLMIGVACAVCFIAFEGMKLLTRQRSAPLKSTQH